MTSFFRSTVLRIAAFVLIVFALPAQDWVKVEMDVPAQGTFSTQFPLGKRVSWSQLHLAGKSDIAGVHLYQEPKPDGTVVCSIRLSNGTVQPNGSGWCGKIYFDAIRISSTKVIILSVLRSGERMSGAFTYEVAPALPPPQKHVFLPNWMLERRFALAGSAGIPASRRYLELSQLKIPDPVVDFGPTHSLQPSVNRAAYQAQYSTILNSVRHAIASGQKFYSSNVANIMTGPMGPWQPDGHSRGDEPGGFGIDTALGYEQCLAAVLVQREMHMLNMDRMPMALFRSDNGRPMSLNNWPGAVRPELINDPYTPNSGRLVPPSLLTGTGQGRTYRVFNPGFVCPYEWALGQYGPFDTAHLIRGIRNGICSWEYSQDRMALDDLEMIWEWSRLFGWSDRNDEKVNANYPGEYIPPSLKRLMVDATNRPHVGHPALDRAYAWMMYLCAFMVDNYPTSHPDWRLTGNNLLLLAERTATPQGIILNKYAPSYMPPNVSGTQTFHSGLTIWGQYALSEALFGNVPASQADVITRACNSMYELLPVRPYYNAVGPPHWIGIFVNGEMVNPPQDQYAYGTGDPAHVHAALAAAYNATGDVRWLQVGLRVNHPAESLGAQLGWCRSQSNRAWTAEYEAALSQLTPAQLLLGNPGPFKP